MFAFLHPFFMFCALWFVKVTDRAHTNHLRQHDSEQYIIIEDSWHAFIMHYEYRRIKLLEEEFFGEGSFYQAIEKRWSDDPKVQTFFAFVRQSIKKCYSAWEESRDMLIQFSYGTTDFIDISLINSLDKLITSTYKVRDVARLILRPKRY